MKDKSVLKKANVKNERKNINKKEVLELLKEGYTHQSIADYLGCSRLNISYYKRVFTEKGLL